MKDINKRLNVDISVDGRKGINSILKDLGDIEKRVGSVSDKSAKELRKKQRELKSLFNEELKEQRLREEGEKKYLQLLRTTEEYKRRVRAEERKERNDSLSYWRTVGKSMAEANRLSARGSKAVQADIESRVKGDTAKQALMLDPFRRFSVRGLLKEGYSASEAKRRKAIEDMETARKTARDPQASASARAEAKTAMKAARTAELEAGAKSASLAKASLAVSVISAVWDTTKKIASAFNGMLKNTLGISLSLKDNFRDVMGYMKESFDMYKGVATFSVGTSLITNARARESMMRYGLSAGQNYAFTQARQLLGLGTEEDLMYMNPAQSAALARYMDRYSAWYEQMSSSGVLQDIQTLQLDFAMFKQEMSVDFLKWVGDNKEDIMAVLRGSLSVLKWIFEAIAKVANFLMPGSMISSSATANASGGAGAKSVTVNMTANASGVMSSQDEMREFFSEEIERLAGEIAVELGE